MAKFDIVLYGASGFTGRLVAEYLRDSAPRDLSWAVAGRNRVKLAAVLAELGVEVPILEANSEAPESLTSMAEQAVVVCTTVGPYAKFGLPVVKACADAGTAYCDLTGEVNFIRESIEQYETRACETGARIVHACGFDSVPSDLGTLLLAEHFQGRGDKLARVRFRLGRSRGGFSGGTVASMFQVLEAAKEVRVRRILRDPYALIPADSVRGLDATETLGPSRDKDLGQWTAPFIMAPINTRVVRRSAAVLQYGEHFSYEERMNTGVGPVGMFAATGLCAALAGFLVTLTIPGLRALIRHWLPSPGEGPSRVQREQGFFEIALHGEGGNGGRAIVTVKGEKDPGYGETSKMIAEAAICLARAEGPWKGGIFTPAVAMGKTLVERLRAAGMTFEVS